MDQTVAGTMAVTAFVFAASALPIFLFLKERSVPRLDAADREAVRSAASESFAELRRTLGSLGDFRDFAWLSVCGFLYQCGVSVVITLSAVYAAAVILPDNYQEILALSGLNDSKKLSEKKRDVLAEAIKTYAKAYAVAFSTVEEIEEYNILGAALLAMNRAIAALPVSPDFALIDGNQTKTIKIPCRSVIGGDASILAKTARDAYCRDELDKTYPEYGFAVHKGYGTKAHYAAIEKYGLCPEHRPSFFKKYFEKHAKSPSDIQ